MEKINEKRVECSDNMKRLHFIVVIILLSVVIIIIIAIQGSSSLDWEKVGNERKHSAKKQKLVMLW